MSNPQRLRVLWLCGWYPSEVAPFSGDFIQRHANAASLFHDIYVIHVVKYKCRKRKSFRKISIKKEGQHVEEIVYYSDYNGLFGKIRSQILFAFYFTSSAIRYVIKNGKPHAIHFHVGYQLGFSAWLLRRIFKTPQLLTEHWTGFLPEAEFRLRHVNHFQIHFLRRLLHSVKGLHAVSFELLKHINGISVGANSVVIPNVVDESIFFPSEFKSSYNFLFVHVSNMSVQKGPEELFLALKILQVRGLDLRLLIIGDLLDKSSSIITQLELDPFVEVMGEIPQSEVATYLRTSDAMVHSAHYETFGCVLIEAFASGIPVVAYDLPVFKELIVPGKNGVVAKQMTPESLADAMEQMMNTIKQYDSDQIRADAVAKYSMPVVAAQFDAWYKSCLAINPRTSIE